MVEPAKPLVPSGKNFLRRHLGFITVVLSGLLGSLALYSFAHHTEQRRIHNEFLRRASVRHALISESIHGYEECVYNLHNLFANSDAVTLTEFLATTRDIRTRHPGIQALQWVPVVPDSRRAEVEAWARREITPSYAFTERNSAGATVPAANRPVYHPILFIDPLPGNEPALGFDLSVGPTRTDLDRSVRDRKLVMTHKIRLVQEQSGIDRFGVIMACPVFREIEGREQLAGFVQMVFKIDDMLDRSWTAYPTNLLDTLILDITRSNETDPFLYSRSAQSDSKAPLTLADLPSESMHRAELSIGGRTWGCYYAPSAGWIDQQISATPFLILGGGLVFSFVLGAYFLSVRHRSEQVRHQVNERTAELRHTQGLLEADIRKRQTVEAELRESRRQLDSLLGQMPGMAYRYVNHTPPLALFISRGSLEIIGFTSQDLVSGKVRYDELILPEDLHEHQEIVTAALARQGAYESEYRIRDKNGSIKWVLDRGQGIYSTDGVLLFIEGLAIDVTGRKQAEADKAAFDRKLLESQKLESLGLLAGGIAHDFNNLLTTIVGHASILGLDLPKHSPLHPHLEQIEAGAHRAGELCQQMLAYAGKGRFLVQRTSLEKLVRDTTPLLEHSINKRAVLRFDFCPEVAEVDADATQIRQIIMNLVVNASDAIGDNDGVITIETCTLDRHDPQLASAALPVTCDGDKLSCLRIRDTGSGMSPETISKIFDPFFTTKFTGRGLGLAAVLGIVRSHHGSLLVNSTPGAGSAFTLILPATSLPRRDQASPAPEAPPPVAVGTVLLIDDEESVRAVADHMFHSLGFKTITAGDGLLGLELFKQHQSVISIVLLDLSMPRMSGAKVLGELRAIAPRLPVIIMSGHNEMSVPELAKDAHVRFLQKPFSIGLLRSEITKSLV